MDRFMLESLDDALLFEWEICCSKARCLRPLSEVCKILEDDWKRLERPQLEKVYKKWLLKYHPDKWHGLCDGEKEIASFIIKEYGQVFQYSNKVMYKATSKKPYFGNVNTVKHRLLERNVLELKCTLVKMKTVTGFIKDFNDGLFCVQQPNDVFVIPQNIENLWRDVILVVEEAINYQECLRTAYCEMHSLNGRRIFTGECFACGVEASTTSYETEDLKNHEESALSELVATKYGKKIWKIKPSGYCMVEAWDLASKQAHGKKLDDNYKPLLRDAVNELRQNPDIYNLIGDYENELLMYETFGDYTKGAIDWLPFALVNVTNLKCTLIQVKNAGKECSLTLYPFTHDVNMDYVGAEIKLVFSRLRRHYDVAVDVDF